MMKTVKMFCGTLLVLAMALFVTACSVTSRTADDILSDIETAGFKTEVSQTFDALSEINQNSSCDISCTITECSKFKTTNIYECEVICSNEDFEITYDIETTYIKNDGWNLSQYEIVNTSSKMKKEISNDRISSDIIQYFTQYYDNVTLNESSISQEIKESGIGSEVTATGTIVKGILEKEFSAKVNYIFTDKWCVNVNYTVSSYTWNVQALSGKKWLDTYKWSEGDFIYIESVDDANSTMMVGYRGLYSSTIDGPYEEHGKPIQCKYTQSEKCIKIIDGPVTFEINPDMSILMSGYKTYPSN